MRNLLEILDLVIAAVLMVWLTTLDNSRRKSLKSGERKEFEAFANDVAERNIAANVAARVVQGTVTVGGFLFAGLFALIFQASMKPFSGDIVIAIVWAIVSLISGAVNLALLAPQSVIQNVALSRFFSILTMIQLVALLGAFIRMGLVIGKFFAWI